MEQREERTPGERGKNLRESQAPGHVFFSDKKIEKTVSVR